MATKTRAKSSKKSTTSRQRPVKSIEIIEEPTVPAVILANTEIDQDSAWANWPNYDSKTVSAGEVSVKTKDNGKLCLLQEDKSLGELTPNAIRQMGWSCNFKSDFLEKLSSELSEAVVNYRLKQTTGKFQVISSGDKLTSFAPGWRPVVKCSLIAQVVFNELVKYFGDNVALDFHSISEHSLKLRFMTSIQGIVTPAVGDVLNYGVAINYEPAREISVSLYANRLTCLNGAKSNQQLFRWTSAKSSTEEDQLLFLANSAVKAIEYHEVVTQHAIEMSQTTFDGDVNAILRERAASIGLESHVSEIIGAFEQEPGNTEWHLFNALTRYATHSTKLDFDQQSRIQSIAGDYLTNYDVVTAELPRNVARRVGARILDQSVVTD